MKKIIKKVILFIGYYSGIFDLFRFYNNKREFVPILAYHGVAADEDESQVRTSFKLKALTVSLNRFEEQIKYLSRKYEIISLPEYIRRKKLKEKLSGCAVITFDDGFKDFLTNAREVLKRHHAPATVFIVTGFLERVHWQHRMYFILDQAQKDKADLLLGAKKISVSLRNDRGKYLSINNLIAALRSISKTDREQAINRLAFELGVIIEPMVQEMYLTEADLRLLASEGVTLGGHSVSHDFLTDASEKQLNEEIATSVNYIKSITQQPGIPFALPYGISNQEVIEAVKAKGCSCNFVNKGGLNGPDDDLYYLKRIVPLDHSLAEFVYNVSGAQMFISRIWR